MCSIIGYKGKFEIELVKKILFNSRIRGLHSFGFSYYDKNNLINLIYLDYNEFLNSILTIKPNLFIAHFRYSTSGDYKVLKNNQPIYFNQTSIVFNGVISQKNKLQMEKQFDLKLFAENDGYVLIQKYNDSKFIKSKNISFAMLGLNENKMFAIRNEKRPLHFYSDSNVTAICSTKDILNRSGLLQTKEVNPYEKIIF